MNPRRIILSRKGFDTKYGGIASPILPFPDNTLLSLPIPDNESGLSFKDIYYNNQSYEEIISSLLEDKTEINVPGVISGSRKNKQLLTNSSAHLDPDIYIGVA